MVCRRLKASQTYVEKLKASRGHGGPMPRCHFPFQEAFQLRDSMSSEGLSDLDRTAEGI